ncbi:MAG: hypothetical protein WBP93_17340 [Pyrinomonadaceae bacterium]
MPRGRAALVVAHPGHELRVYGWLESAQPRVFVLTDGSGRSGCSRLRSTAEILSRTGASAGPIFGRFTDLALYQAILQHDHQLFVELARELTEEFFSQHIEYVLGDAAEGYNPAHEICRLLLNASVAMAARLHGIKIDNYDFLLKGRPDECPERLRHRARWLHLDDESLSRKLKAADNYPELAAEVKQAISENGASAFRVECLRPPGEGDLGGDARVKSPFYEQYGEQQVAAGHYASVIRYREHLAPLAEALRQCV